MAETSKSVKNIYNWLLLVIVIAAVVLINIIGSFIYTRIDMTEDSRYSLSEGTVSFLESKGQLKNRLLIKIYLQGNLPAEVKRFRDAIEDKLVEFKQYAGDRIEYEFIDPKQGNEADQAYLFETLYNKGQGIIPLRLQFTKDGVRNDMEVWPGATLEYGGSTRNSIQFLPGTAKGQFYTLNANFESQIQNSINNLEYMLISAIRRATMETKPRVAFLQGHGELKFQQTQRVRALISPYYTVEDLTLNDSITALENVKGLVIARPTQPFSDKDEYLIDQFVMRGGRLMVFMDKLTFPEDTLNVKGMVHTTRIETGLDRMLFDYGMKLNDNYVIDAYCAPKAVPMAKQSIIPWFFDIAASQTTHPISRNIDPVMLRYVSEIEFTDNEGRVATPILTSSSNSTTTGMAPLISLGLPLNYDQNNPKLVPDPENEANKVCLAGLVEGNFVSHFKNRINEAFSQNSESGFLEKSSKEGKVLVVGNGRFIQNYYDSMPNALGMMQYRPTAFNNLRLDETMARFEGAPPIIYGNQEFFQNIVDYMMDDNSVLDLRSRQIDIHPIDQEKVKTEAGFYKLMNMVIPSLSVLILAFILFYLRKRRYARS